MALSIYTNNQPRHTVCGYELTEEERKEFDYYTPDMLDTATFFRYKKMVYDLGEFMWCNLNGQDQPSWARWDGYLSDTYFSGILVRICRDGDSVVVARYMC